MNLYGFRRLSRGVDQGCYFHPKFQRDKKELLSEIKRLPIKGTLQTYDQVINSSSSSGTDKDKSLSSHQKRKLMTNDENGKMNNHSHLTRSSSSTSISTRTFTEPVMARNTITNPVPKIVVPEATAKPFVAPSSVAPYSISPKPQAPLATSTQSTTSSAQYNYNHQISFASSTAKSMAPTNNLPTMSKLTMNIGYGKNMINNFSTTVARTPISSFNQFSQSFQPPSANVPMVSTNSCNVDDFDFLELFDNSQSEAMQIDYIPTFDEAMHLHSIEGSNF